jgi:exodeoxyribonuclease V alpha subunit
LGANFPNWFGNTLIDIIEKKNIFQVNELTKIQRQAQDSGIIVDANQIRDGIDPLNGIKELKTIHGKNQDMYYMFRNTKEELHSIAIKTYLNSIESVGLDNVLLLSPRKENCLNSSKTFNTEIQDILLDKSLPFVKWGDKIFRLGAKTIHRVNNYDLKTMNGETGYISNIFEMSANGGNSLEVKYPDKFVIYTKSDLKELELAYSVSIHLAQGSEAHTVILVLDNNGFSLFSNCILYTGISRSKSRCLLLSQPFAYDKCISTNVGNLRDTWMKGF